MRRKGFTLIELLIVIVLLGILAAALAAAIDPLEQFKKGDDTGTRNTAAEVHGALTRYFALKGWMAWCTGVGTCTSPNQTPLASEPMVTAISRLKDAGELKSNFEQLAGTANLTRVIVTSDSTNELARVCFNPRSKAISCEINTKYNADGTVNTSCPGTACGDSTSTCHWCLQ